MSSRADDNPGRENWGAARIVRIYSDSSNKATIKPIYVDKVGVDEQSPRQSGGIKSVLLEAQYILHVI